MSSCCVLPQLQVIAATIISNIISRGAQVDLAPCSCCPPGCSCRCARRQRCPQRGLSARAPWPHWGRPATRACAACCPQGPTCMRPQSLCRLRVTGRPNIAAACLHAVFVSSSHLCTATVHGTQRSYGPSCGHRALGHSGCGCQQVSTRPGPHAQRGARPACRRGCARRQQAGPGPSGRAAGCQGPGCLRAACQARGP